MNKRLSRAFVALSFTLLFTAMIGIVAVGLLTAAENQLSPIELTSTAIILTNIFPDAELTDTQTAAANPADTLTAIPYEPTLFAQRRTQQYEIMASMGPTEAKIFDATETALVAAYQITEEQPVTPGPCAFMWAQQTLPDVAEQARKVLDEADLTNVEVRGVAAYGENCVEPEGGKIRYFAAMTTDFYLSAAVNNLDEANLGQIVEQTYNTLIAIPRDSLPTRPGYLDFSFTAVAREKRLRVTFDQVRAALDEGARGAELWTALGK